MQGNYVDRRLSRDPDKPGDAERTPEVPVLDSISEALQARLLQTSLDDADWVDPDENANAAGERLRTSTYDQAPAGHRPKVDGFVLLPELLAAPSNSSASQIVHALDASHLLSASAPVLAALEAF